MLNRLINIFSYNVLILILTTISGIIIARTLGPEERGNWAEILFYPAFLSTFLPFGLDTYISISSSHSKNTSYNLFKTIIIFTTIIGIPASLILISFNRYFINLIDQQLHGPFLCLSLGIPLALLNLLLYSFELGNGNIKNYNLGRLLFSITYLLLIFIVTINTTLNLNYIVATYLISNILTVLLLLNKILTNRFKALKQETNTYSFLNILKSSTPYGVSNTTLMLANQIPMALIISKESNENIGYYVVALTVSSIHTVFFNSIGKVFLSRSKVTDTKEDLMPLRLTFSLNILLYTSFIFILPILIIILYGNQYKSSIDLLYYILPYTILIAYFNSIDEYLKSCSLWRHGFYMRIIAIFGMIVTSLVLGDYFSITLFYLINVIIISIVIYFTIRYLAKHLKVKVNNITLTTTIDIKRLKLLIANKYVK